jgi:hypothetical protein
MPKLLRRAFNCTHVLALLAAALLALPVGATMLQPVSLEQLVERADLILHGTVLQSEGRLDERTGMVFTHFTVRVDEAILDSGRSSTVEVVVPGGVDGYRWTQVDGAPDLGADGQDVVLFLYGDRGERMSNIVFWQGLYHVDGGRVRQTGEPVANFLTRVRKMLPRPMDEGGPVSAGGSGGLR